MTLDEYQEAAKSTAVMDISTIEGKLELVLGLSAEAGAVSKIYKKLVRDSISLGAQTKQLTDELGDVLWYVALIAESMDIRLQTVGSENLVRTDDRYHSRLADRDTEYKPNFEAGAPEKERFPRIMVFRMEEMEGDGGLPHSKFTIEYAEPNEFPNGIEIRDEDGRKKKYGFTIGEPLGDVVNDNAIREDGYRYHDAVHIAFMTVLGWSPVMRALLRLKRKYDDRIDRFEDGARAIDLEEALSAVLKEFSESRNDFNSAADIDGETRDIIRRVIANLESDKTPIWLWVEAIHQGYSAMNALRENKGGWILADLDNQNVKFFAENPITTLVVRAG